MPLEFAVEIDDFASLLLSAVPVAAGKTFIGSLFTAASSAADEFAFSDTLDCASVDDVDEGGSC